MVRNILFISSRISLLNIKTHISRYILLLLLLHIDIKRKIDIKHSAKDQQIK